jgi:hypothetical protein
MSSLEDQHLQSSWHVSVNAGATYQRAIQTCLGEQIGDNAEAYVDDIVVKKKIQTC